MSRSPLYDRARIDATRCRSADLAAFVVARLFRSPFDLGEVAGSVDDPHHLRPVFNHSVKRQPTFDNQRPRILGDFGAEGAKPRVLS